MLSRIEAMMRTKNDPLRLALSRRAVCPSGHELNEENTTTDGRCKICRNAWFRAYKRRRYAKELEKYKAAIA